VGVDEFVFRVSTENENRRADVWVDGAWRSFPLSSRDVRGLMGARAMDEGELEGRGIPRE
jgi:hypothetical protein